jgi:hypothetical protein
MRLASLAKRKTAETPSTNEIPVVVSLGKRKSARSLVVGQ